MPLKILKDIGFHDVVAKWFEQQFSKPSPPQRKGWPAIARGEHTLIMAPTGSGKTLAAFLWSIDDLFRIGFSAGRNAFSANPQGVHTLYISPLKALNNDIERNLRFPLKSISEQALTEGITSPEIRVAVRTGDTPSHLRQKMLKQPPHILITTPESLYLLLTSERGRPLFGNLRYLIVDEIHSLSNNKRGVHLSLSLERLCELSAKEPVRIGLSATQRPLDRIAAFLGGQQFDPNHRSYSARTVKIIDCGQRKQMDLRVVAPVPSYRDLPESSVWPAVYNMLYTHILEHKTTLIFTGVRDQTERISRRLNELHRKATGDPSAILAMAHHGSISREVRYAIEAKLKSGRIPAVVATASLELGIDIGSIDLVIQLESPKSVAGGLQRVGRSGHLMDATSKGLIVPLYQADLDDAVALARSMRAGEIEETRIPESPLDVLAQQILAEVSMRECEIESLFHLFKQSYCYRNLSKKTFDQVIEMLAGRYADSPLKALKPKLNLDTVNSKLIPLPGSRLSAVFNAGTIPDRAYYSVILQGSNTNLGEMDEEFVFESRPGDIFFLGNNEWRIEDIRQDRIIVTPVSEIKPRAPFWKGDLLHREFSTSLRIAEFKAELVEQIEKGTAREWLLEDGLVDEHIVDNLLDFYKRQVIHSGHVANHREIVLEWFRDESDEPLLLVHCPFGAKVNAPWAIALAKGIERHFGTQTQYAYDDDAILVRLLDTEDPVPLDHIMKLNTREVEDLLISTLEDTQIFAIHFRYNAARALLLGRSRPGKRIPLWLQRLRAADLAQQVRPFPDFPIIIETYRECLHDLFDLPALKSVLQDIESGKIQIRTVSKPTPSPMTTGILFKFLSENLYELDRSREPGEADPGRSKLLNEILTGQDIPRIVDRSAIQRVDERLQHLTPHSKARDKETLIQIIEKLGPLTDQQLDERSRDDCKVWLDELQKEGRIYFLEAPWEGWITAEIKSRFTLQNPAKDAGLLINRYLENRGPVSGDQLHRNLPLETDLIASALEELIDQKKVIHGQLIMESEEEYYCNLEVFKEIYRAAIGQRRKRTVTANQDLLIPFLLNWHHIDRPGLEIRSLIEHYRGFVFTSGFFQNELLYSRMCPKDAYQLGNKLSELHQEIETGELIVQRVPSEKTNQDRFRFFPRGEGHLFIQPGILAKRPDALSDRALRVYQFLKENGASLRNDLLSGLELSHSLLDEALNELVNSELVTTDNLQTLTETLESQSESGGKNKSAEIPSAPRWSRSKRPVRSLRRSDLRHQLQSTRNVQKGRWFLTSSFAVMGKKADEEEMAVKQARVLLQRYGILVKEWYRHEEGLLPWYELFQVLKKLEWQGEAERGYFIEGLSGIQFATAEALKVLHRLRESPADDHTPVWVSTIDPALPLGGAIPWNVYSSDGHPVEISRSAINHLLIKRWKPVVYSENFGRRLRFLRGFKNDDHGLLTDAIKAWLRRPPELVSRKRIEIELIEGVPAGSHPIAENFLRAGYEVDGNRLILWPSGV